MHRSTHIDHLYTCYTWPQTTYTHATHGPRPPILMLHTTQIIHPCTHTRPNKSTQMAKNINNMTKHLHTHRPAHEQHVHTTPTSPNDAPLQGGRQMSKKTTYTHATHGPFRPPIHLYMTKHVCACGHTHGQQCTHETNGPKMMLK